MQVTLHHSVLLLPESGIRSYGDFCVVPNNAGCSPPDGTHLIFTKKRGSACNATDMIFVFDWDGVIHHKCSKKVICPQGNSAIFFLTFSSFCSVPFLDSTFTARQFFLWIIIRLKVLLFKSVAIAPLVWIYVWF